MCNCKVCHTVLLVPHRSLLFWVQCPLCSYCEVDESSKAVYPDADLYANRNLEVIAKTIIDKEKAEQIKHTNEERTKTTSRLNQL